MVDDEETASPLLHPQELLGTTCNAFPHRGRRGGGRFMGSCPMPSCLGWRLWRASPGVYYGMCKWPCWFICSPPSRHPGSSPSSHPPFGNLASIW